MRVLFFITALFIFCTSTAQTTDFVELSKELLNATRYDKSTKKIEKQLAEVSLADLDKDLNTDVRRKTFWMNIYNAYVQILLKDAPEKFEDRGKFFTSAQIPLVQRQLSFDDIEHGIIRGSQAKLSLGFLPKLFVSKFERKLRVSERDGRIHFALNCGAKSCPPIPILDAQRLDEQLDESSRRYLKSTSVYNKDKNIVNVTALFSWFRGDFGNLSGAKDYLRRYGVIPEEADPSLNFNTYDWTLDLGNYIDL